MRLIIESSTWSTPAATRPKTAAKINTAKVNLIVSFLVGQVTCLTSLYEFRKYLNQKMFFRYLPTALKGLVRKGAVINLAGFLNGLVTFLTTLRTGRFGCLLAFASAFAVDFSVR